MRVLFGVLLLLFGLVVGAAALVSGLRCAFSVESGCGLLSPFMVGGIAIGLMAIAGGIGMLRGRAAAPQRP